MTIREDLTFPEQIDVLVVPAEPKALTVSASLGFDPRSEQYLGMSTSFSSPLAPVTSTTVKATPMHRMIVPELRTALHREPGNTALADRCAPLKTYFLGTRGRRVASAVAVDPPEHVLEQAAAVYTAARAVRDTPVRSIERCFGITYAQAKRWTRAMRRLGHLD